MKKHLACTILLCCAHTLVKAAAFAPKKVRLEVTEHHLTRIIFQRGLGFFVFGPEASGAVVFKNNVTKSVTQATKKLFIALAKLADIDMITCHLRSGADIHASLTFEHKGNTISVTPAFIIAVLEHPFSAEIFQAFSSAESQISTGIDQITSNYSRSKPEPEFELEKLYQEVMGRFSHPHGTALPLTPPESPQETEASFKTTYDISKQDLQALLLAQFIDK